MSAEAYTVASSGAWQCDVFSSSRGTFEIDFRVAYGRTTDAAHARTSPCRVATSLTSAVSNAAW